MTQSLFLYFWFHIYCNSTEQFVNNSAETLTNDVNISTLFRKEFSEASEKSFAENVNGEYKIEDAKKEISEAFSGGTVRAKKAFKKFTTKDDVVTWNSQNGVYHQGGKIYFNVAEMTKDGKRISTGYFHEFGHKIDFEARGTSTRLSLSRNKFGELIRSDAQAYIEDFEKTNGTFGSHRKITDILSSKDKMISHHGVADILEGVTKGSIHGKYGHLNQPGYWQQLGAIESEAFAHMFQAQFNNEEYEIMKEYFPNALEEFESLLEGVI